MNKVPPILISKGQDVWLADLKALNKEKYLFRGLVPVRDLISLAWAKALWAIERRAFLASGVQPRVTYGLVAE